MSHKPMSVAEALAVLLRGDRGRSEMDRETFFSTFLAAAATAQTRDELIYATLVTERMLTDEGAEGVDPAVRTEWRAAIDGFRRGEALGIPAHMLIAAAYHWGSADAVITKEETNAGRRDRDARGQHAMEAVLDAMPVPDRTNPAAWYASFLRTAADADLEDALIFAVLTTEAGGVFESRPRRPRTEQHFEKEFHSATDMFDTAIANGVLGSDLIAAAYRNEVPSHIADVWRREMAKREEEHEAAVVPAEAASIGIMRYVYIDAAAEMSVRTSTGEVPLDQLRALVGGNIEGIYGDGRVFVYDNEDGIALGLAPTVRLPKVNSVGNVLRGPVVLVGDNGHGGQRDLTDAELRGIYLTRTDGDPYSTLHIDPPESETFGFGVKRPRRA